MLLEETKFQVKNAGSLFFGGDPWHTAYYTAFIDEIKFSNTTYSCKNNMRLIYIFYIADDLMEVVSEIYQVGGIFSKVTLGCLNTRVDDVVNCCQIDTKHVCSANELLQGGYRVAKMMGWMKGNEYPKVWTYEELDMDYA